MLALLATACWSTTALFIETLYRDYHMTALEIAFWRVLLMGGFVGIYLAVRYGRKGFIISRRELAIYAINGVVGVAIFNIAWNVSVQENGPAVATTLIYCGPVFVVLGSWPLLGERVGLDRVLAILVNLTGCALVAGALDPAALIQSPVGGLIGIASGFTFAFYTLLGKITARSVRRNNFTTLFYLFLFGLITLLPVGLYQEGGRLLTPSLDWVGWLLLATLACGPTLGGYIFFNSSLKYLPAAIASLFTTLEPPITAVLSFLILSKGMGGIQWLGAALIVSWVVGLQLNDLRLSLKGRLDQ
jgi:drug/metabolite transporter (DMT)-like permease